MGWREWEENYIEWTRSMPSTFSWYVLLIVLVIFPSVSLYISSLLFHGIGMPTGDGAALLPKGHPAAAGDSLPSKYDTLPSRMLGVVVLQVLGVGCGNSRLEDNLLWWGVAAAGGTCIDRLAGNEEMLP